MGRRSVLALVAGAGAILWWRVWPAAAVDPPPPPPKPAPIAYVPLSGGPLWEATQRGGPCLPFLAPLRQYRNWRFRIARGYASCSGDHISDHYEVSADRIVWTGAQTPPRTLELDPVERAMLTAIDQLDCRARYSRYDVKYLRVGVGDDPAVPDGALIPLESPAGDYLEAILDGAMTHYTQRRFRELGPIAIRATLRREDVDYDVRVIGHRVVVRRGGTVLGEEAADDFALVQLVDGVLAGTYGHDGDDGHGELSAGGTHRAFVVSRGEDDRSALLWNAIYRSGR